MSQAPTDHLSRRTLVMIPALNEAATLPGVLSTLKRWPFDSIRVIDNGSTDGTAELAATNGGDVLVESARGYGSACWKGLQNLPQTIDWILFCDADGSDDLRALDPFLKPPPRAMTLCWEIATRSPKANAHLPSRNASAMQWQGI